MDHLATRASDPLVCTGPDGEVLWCNEAMARILGWDRDTLLRMRIPDFDADWSLETWVDARAKYLAAGRVIVQTVFRRRDGTTFPVEVHADRMDVDGAEVAFSTIRDITASRQTEDRLARQVAELDERRRFVENMMNTSPDFLWVYDLRDRRNLYMSRQFERVMGYSTEELIALKGEILPRLVHPDDFAHYRQYVLPRYAGLADGEILPLRFRVDPGHQELTLSAIGN